MAKEPKSGTRKKRKPREKAPNPVHNEATVDEFEREGMGVAPKE